MFCTFRMLGEPENKSRITNPVRKTSALHSEPKATWGSSTTGLLAVCRQCRQMWLSARQARSRRHAGAFL